MKTLQELKDIKAAKGGQVDIRFNPDTAEEAVKTYVLVCGGTGCQSNHSVEVMDELNKLIDAAGKKDEAFIVAKHADMREAYEKMIRAIEEACGIEGQTDDDDGMMEFAPASDEGFIQEGGKA